MATSKRKPDTRKVRKSSRGKGKSRQAAKRLPANAVPETPRPVEQVCAEIDAVWSSASPLAEHRIDKAVQPGLLARAWAAVRRVFA